MFQPQTFLSSLSGRLSVSISLLSQRRFCCSDASHISLIIAFIGRFFQKRRLIFQRTQEKTPMSSSQQMPKNRRALPVRCGMAGANDASLYPANQKGARVLPFSAAGGMPTAMLAGLTDRLPSPPTFSFFRYLYYPHTRSTLRDNCVQRERWGNYTIFILRTAFSGLSARVSDNRYSTLLSQML